ncbi:uncharacterized protein LOC143549305 [Bidens hawaiensis]|uniref:uncharacterized protein LOC143549305 n=1 Tax=Bidens hawaiensis TaxID=980011 RepID=UPI00404B4FDB
MEFQGDSQVKGVKLQGLRRDFENLSMKDNELVGDYFSRVMAIVSQKRAFGETVSDQTIVEKILRNMSPKFYYVVPSIEELQVFQDGSSQSRLNNNGGSRGRGRGPFRGRGRDRGLYKSKVPQCTLCNKFGHLKADCWYNDEPQVNIATEEQEESETKEDQRLFMAIITQDEASFNLMTHTLSSGKTNSLWFIDFGCSNHMTGSKCIFTKLDESFKLEVQLGDKKKLNVEGRGTVRIVT